MPNSFLACRPLRVAAIATLLGAPAAAAAQEPLHSSTTPQRVRLLLADPAGRLDGVVVGWRGDTLLLVTPRDPRAAPPVRILESQITGFRVSLGHDRGRGARRGARWGALVGGGLGLAVLGAAAVYDLRGEGGDYFFPASLFAALYVPVFTVGGTVIGLGLGALVAPERWGAVQPLAPGAPRRGGVSP